MFRGIYGDDNFIRKIDFKNTKISQVPDAFYDKHLLCTECDNNVIGKLESYAKKMIFGGILSDKLKPNKSTISDGVIKISNIDYTKFKLFLLSILWRSHISKRKEFEEVDLGSYAEAFRTMILKNIPGDESKFETCIFYVLSKKTPTEVVSPPTKHRYNGNTFYHFLINKMHILYNISDYNKLSVFQSSSVKKDNTLVIYGLKGDKAVEIHKKFTGINFEL